MRTLLVLLAGTALGAALVVACGHGVGNTDAADACNCPAAEPPLAGRIQVVQGNTATIPPNQIGGQGAGCPTGATFLSGSCAISPDTLINGDVILAEAAVDTTTPGVVGWGCQWKNNGTVTVTGTARAVCLMPAQ